MSHWRLERAYIRSDSLAIAESGETIDGWTSDIPLALHFLARHLYACCAVVDQLRFATLLCTVRWRGNLLHAGRVGYPYGVAALYVGFEQQRR